MSGSNFPTRSFILLLAIAVLASAAATFLVYNSDFSGSLAPVTNQKNQNGPELRPVTANAESVPETKVDTSNWNKYQDANYDLNFKMPNDWKVSTTVTNNNIYTLVIQPTHTSAQMKIFISSKNYVGTTGLQSEPAKVGGQTAINIDDLVFGVQHDSQYYTFDAGTDLKLKPEFSALVASVEFDRN